MDFASLPRTPSAFFKDLPMDHHNEKSTRPSSSASPIYLPSSPVLLPQSPIHLPSPSHFNQPAPLFIYTQHPTTTSRHRRLRLTHTLTPWIPLILYAITSLVFVVAIAWYRTELFVGLDQLSLYLQRDPEYGYAVLFCLIFLTTIPPIPLYSTLTVLSGYTFGAWTGAVISYCAALTGAVVVFIISRTLLRECISRWLASTVTIRRVVRAIEKRPKLLFLVRLAPYPYNVMNCLLAASPTLTFKTYTLCTALSLFKVIIHTSLGASIHSFADYDAAHKAQQDDDDASNAHSLARIWTIFGVLLCVAIFVYLSIVARRAVDEEIGQEDTSTSADQNLLFLTDEQDDLEANLRPNMAQSPLNPNPSTIPFRRDGQA
jgi:uncharacterized membrane protein YdjX (TVP38/TMEM64 family)